MGPDVLFEKFPDVLLSSFRQQMLLGIVPADTVQQILKPLLSNFHELMLQLPAGLRGDLENILRIYPEVAQGFGVSIKPPVVLSLRSLAGRRAKPGFGVSADEEELDMAAEPRAVAHFGKKSPVGSFMKEGQGFFTTDRGAAVYIEFSYSEEDDCVSFACKPQRLSVEIRICGVVAATLTPSGPNRKIPVDRLARIIENCAREIEIKIIELN